MQASPSPRSGTPQGGDASGYLLLTIQHAIIKQLFDGDTMVLAQGEMRLECVSLPIPSELGKQTANPFAPSPADPAVPTHDFWLILNVGTFEMPLIPTQGCTPSLNTLEGVSYTFASQTIPDAFVVLTLPLPGSTAELEDLDSLEVLLRQYGSLDAEATALQGVTAPQLNEDMKGRLVLVNEESGEMVGELDQTIDVQEDKRVGLNKDKPVVLDFGDVVEGYAHGVVVQTVPEAEMDDWLLKGAHYLSKGILGVGDIASKGITGGADLFIRNTKAAEKPVQFGPRTKTGIRVTHNASVKTVTVAKSTIGKINDSIQNVVEKTYHKFDPAVEFYKSGMEDRRPSFGGGVTDKRPPPPIPPKPSHTAPPSAFGSHAPPPINTALQGQSGAPPAYSAYPTEKATYTATPASATGPSKAEIMLAEQNAALGLQPPRSTSRPASPGSLVPGPTPAQTSGGNSPQAGPSTPNKRPLLNRLLLAGEVVLTSLEATAHNLIESGTSAASSAAGHKFGAEAGHATSLLGGSVRNVAVVYIDARGIGRKAVLKGTAKGFVKARLKSGETVQLQGDGPNGLAAGRAEGGVQVGSGEVGRKEEGTVVVGMTAVGGPPRSSGGQGLTGRGAQSAPSSAVPKGYGL